MPDVCAEKHKRIDEKFEIDKKRLDNHGDRIDRLEQFRSGTEVEMRNLIEQIKGLISIIKWQMTSLIMILGAFLLWYIQQLN